jgi:23S rRNA (adenine-N6)-dimethyltransferase
MSKNAGRAGAPPLYASQNYLTSSKLIDRLLRLTNITCGDRVIEIGAGKGHITSRLIDICRRVDAFEIDPKLCGRLRERFKDTINLHIRAQDFLTAPLPAGGEYKVFSNIPFSITSDIVAKLTNTVNPPSDAWLVMEDGAAKRFSGSPRETRASLMLKPFFDTEIIYRLSRFDFHPAPSVDAALLRLTRKAQPDVPARLKRDYMRFVERGLRYGADSMLTKKQATAALRRAGLGDIHASATMLYVQWLCLFRCYRGV